MFVLLAYCVVVAAVIYGFLRLFLSADMARAVLFDIGNLFILLVASCAIGIIIRMMMPGGDSWGQAILKDPSFLGVWRWYREVTDPIASEHRYVILAYPIIGLVQIIATFLNITILHFTPVFLFSHAVLVLFLYVRFRAYASGNRFAI